VDDEDLRLIRAAKQGDREAFTWLVRHYKRYVYKTAFDSLGDHMDAEDVAQEAFVRAFLSLSQLQEERAFPSWILTITTRLAFDTIKRRERTKAFNRDPERIMPTIQQDQTEGAIQRMLLINLMKNLSEEFRTVLVMREIQGRSYQEIADLLDIPMGTVRSRLHTARLQMRTLIHQSEKEDTSHDM